TEVRCNTKSASFVLSSTEKITTQKCDSPKNNGFSAWIKYQSMLHYIIMKSHICISSTLTENPKYAYHRIDLYVPEAFLINRVWSTENGIIK
ncbi:hypothetical protein T4A_1721, partial [Trichinella pseudospiralis]